MKYHGRPIRNRIAIPSYEELAVFLQLLDFTIPKAKDHDNNHSNCQSKNWKECQSGEPVPVPIGPSVMLGKTFSIFIEFFPGFGEAPIQLLAHCVKISPCGLIMRLRSRKVRKILFLHR